MLRGRACDRAARKRSLRPGRKRMGGSDERPVSRHINT